MAEETGRVLVVREAVGGGALSEEAEIPDLVVDDVGRVGRERGTAAIVVVETNFAAPPDSASRSTYITKFQRKLHT